MSRILVWFSCGAASAVAAKVAVTRWTDEPVEVCYCAGVEKDEHPDNQRFLLDVQRWLGAEIKKLYHPKYGGIDDVFLGERFIVGQNGAPCTRILKREVRERYQRPDDRHVMGYTADEMGRINAFKERHPELDCIWLLADAGINKEDCYHVISAAGI